MMVMTHELNIPEKLSPLSHQWKSRCVIPTTLPFPCLQVVCIQCGHSGRYLSSWGWFPLKAQVKGKMHEEDWNWGQGNRAAESWNVAVALGTAMAKYLNIGPAYTAMEVLLS